MTQRLWACCALLLVLLLWPNSGWPQDGHVYRFGFSKFFFAEVNENDARAAIKAWGDAVISQDSLAVEIIPSIFDDSETMHRSLLANNLDGVGMTLLEYHRAHQAVPFDPIFGTVVAGQAVEHYVLLAHRDGPIKTLADLRGRSLRVLSGPRSCLATLWLDVHLRRSGQQRAALLAGRMTEDTRLANTVLPVFFRQADACLVTRSGFMTMGELNPQVAQQLIVLAESEPLVPIVYAFRADYDSPVKNDLVFRMLNLSTFPAGQQLMNIFNTDGLVLTPASSLDSALQLIDAHNALQP